MKLGDAPARLSPLEESGARLDTYRMYEIVHKYVSRDSKRQV